MPLEPGFRSPLKLIPGRPPFPVLTSSIQFRHFIDGSLSLVSPDLTRRDQVPPLPRRSPPSLFATQHAVVWNPLLIADPEGPTLISHTAPHLHRCRCVRGTRWSLYLPISTALSAPRSPCHRRWGDPARRPERQHFRKH